MDRASFLSVGGIICRGREDALSYRAATVDPPSNDSRDESGTSIIFINRQFFVIMLTVIPSIDR